MPRIQHTSYQQRRAQYDRIRDVLDGQDAMRANAGLYLRKPDGLRQSQWEQYLKGAHFYPVADTTLRSMLGLAFRKPPSIKVPSRLEPLLKTTTFDGNPINVFAEDILREILSVGRVCAVLDFPAFNETSLALPYISTFTAEAIYDWREGIVDGVKRLTYIRLHEDNDEIEPGIEQHLVMCLEPHLVIRRYHVTGTHGGEIDEVQIDDDIVPMINGKPLSYIPAIIFSPTNLRA